ncbi:MAG: hypothetical protein AB7K09_25300, partial [Planctomycetota bacterium]
QDPAPAPAQPQPDAQPAAQPAQPEPPPALKLRYRFDTDEASRDTLYDYSSHCAATTTITGAGPRGKDIVLTTDVNAGATLRVRCLANAGGDYRLGFGVTRLTFALRDGETTLDFCIGPGLGADGKDGMTAHKDGESSSVRELDFWSGGDYASTLPESMGKDLAQATLSPTGALSRRATVLPEPGTGANSRSIVTWLNPGQLGALLLVAVPDADVTPNPDRPDKPAWDCSLRLPALPGRPAGDALVNCKLTGRVEGKPHQANVEFSSPVSGEPTITGNYIFDVKTGAIESLTIRVSVDHRDGATRITAAHSYRFLRVAKAAAPAAAGTGTGE